MQATHEQTAQATDQVRVLVVDDEPNIVDVISMALRFEGFSVESAGSGADAIASVAASKPQVMVLDVMLPDIDGFEVARRLAGARAGVPILFLTARDGTEDIVRGLTLGGDDYMTKPFSLEELVARIRTILRRSGLTEPESSQLVFADLTLDEDTREVSRGARPIELTATEFRLLRYLMANPRRVLTRGQLLDHVWQYDFGGDARVLETYISYLRKKIDLEAPALIHTVRGVGYSLRLPRG
ncbi:MAG: response regulator transcription factor [Solirubrobacteraceae bacterium]|jgi:two-component system OmpR family response regulator